MVRPTGEIVRQIEALRVQMEADLGVLRQQAHVLKRLYEKLPDSLTEEFVDKGGPAGRVDR